jgi:hypothetical protein
VHPLSAVRRVDGTDDLTEQIEPVVQTQVLGVGLLGDRRSFPYPTTR